MTARGVFVLFEGLPSTVIDSQVLAHVRLVRERLGIDMTVLAVACSRSLHELSLARLERARALAGGDVRLFRGLRPALPGSLTLNRLLLARALRALGPIDFVHARADYAAAVAGLWARRHGISMLWDCRGDSRAELQERLGGRSPLAAAYRDRLLRRELAIAGRTCSGAAFVTPQLRDLMAPYMDGQRSWVIPCLAPKDEFFFDADLRARMRTTLGIAPQERVYVYSGSLAGYQRFDETVAALGAALAAGQAARLIVLTPEVERARAACAGLPPSQVLCRSVGHGEVNSYLNAADFGMLLRDSTPVNRVAFPTKFAEYAMTGLQIVMKDSPPSCVDVARGLGNFVPAGGLAEPWSADARARCAVEAARSLDRAAVLPTYAELYGALVRSGAQGGMPVPRVS